MNEDKIARSPLGIMSFYSFNPVNGTSIGSMSTTLSDNNYTIRFVVSKLEATVTQIIPTKNYARIAAGFEGFHKNFDF